MSSAYFRDANPPGTSQVSQNKASGVRTDTVVYLCFSGLRFHQIDVLSVCTSMRQLGGHEIVPQKNELGPRHVMLSVGIWIRQAEDCRTNRNFHQGTP